jgi:hypothetical protein
VSVAVLRSAPHCGGGAAATKHRPWSLVDALERVVGPAAALIAVLGSGFKLLNLLQGGCHPSEFESFTFTR